MTPDGDASQPGAWYPIASSTDLVPFHVHQAMVQGTELAVWRADDGFVNVWENRCLHRGVRLTLGTTDGAELECAYHGWRYANRTAGCTYIPAHPADAPAQTICNTTYPAVERYGLIWSSLDPVGEPPATSWLEDGRARPLRPLPIHASSEVVVERLGGHRFGTTAEPEASEPTMEQLEGGLDSVVLRSRVGDQTAVTAFFVQPVDADRCIVRGVLADAPPPVHLAMVLRNHNTRLTNLRDAIEARHGSVMPYVDPALRPTSARTIAPPAPQTRRYAPLRVRVRRKWLTATDIVAVELEPTEGPLPSAAAGAHIDLHLPNGLVRQYSLTNGPGDSECYRIGVKREPRSRGGSAYVHDTLEAGDELSISEPRPSFPLRRDAVRTVLLAGGIGVTPLLSMAQTLHRGGLAVELHYFARGDDHLAFPEIRERLGEVVTTHTGLDPAATLDRLSAILGSHDTAHHLYVCGPGPMLESARSIAADLGWPLEAVHFEYFQNTTDIDLASSFEISLARSALTLRVPEGRTILQVLHQAGVPIASSCELGACGTCVARVLEGEPDHQDVRLTEAERARGDQIITCVSRARSDRLILDL